MEIMQSPPHSKIWPSSSKKSWGTIEGWKINAIIYKNILFNIGSLKWAHWSESELAQSSVQIVQFVLPHKQSRTENLNWEYYNPACTKHCEQIVNFLKMPHNITTTVVVAQTICVRCSILNFVKSQVSIPNPLFLHNKDCLHQDTCKSYFQRKISKSFLMHGYKYCHRKVKKYLDLEY